jgi:very-short-patch-repair endonuclease
MTQDIRNIGRQGHSWREIIKSHVRELRKNQTKSEAIAWEIVRNRKLDGKKFLRQHPIVYSFYKTPLYFVADFYCAEARLILEIDGSIHKLQTEYDEQREFILKQKGLRVLRIKNEEFRDINQVKKKILNELKPPPSLPEERGQGG